MPILLLTLFLILKDLLNLSIPNSDFYLLKMFYINNLKIKYISKKI